MDNGWTPFGSDYCEMVELELFISREPDINMARYKVAYRDPVIGEIALHCQKWVDRNFALDYCLKGLFKMASSSERAIITHYRIHYRKMSFFLLKVLAWVFDRSGVLSLNANQNDLRNLMPTLEKLKGAGLETEREELILTILDLFNAEMGKVVEKLETAAKQGEVGRGSRLLEVIRQWKEKTDWVLINA